jgi:hypothetical protein
MSNAQIIALAGQLAASFETAKRNDDQEFTRLKEDAPSWASEAVRIAHGDLLLPDDWRYNAVSEVASAIADLDEDADFDDERQERVDGLVDIYNADLLAWVSSLLTRACYCDEAVEEYGYPRDEGLFKVLQYGQFREYEEIWDQLLGFLKEKAEEDEAEIEKV